MGWLITKGQTRADTIASCTRGWNTDSGAHWDCLSKFASGNCLWAVFERTQADGTKDKRFIGLFLMRRDQGYGWGYKDMAESSHPYYYSCPLKYLDMVPVACEEWREGVRAYHAARSRKVGVGDQIQLTDGRIFWVRQVYPLRVTDGSRLYRMPRGVLAGSVITPAGA